MRYRKWIVPAVKLAIVGLPLLLLVQNGAHAQSARNLNRRVMLVEKKLKALKSLETEFKALKVQLKAARKEAKEAKNQALQVKKAANQAAGADIQWHLGGFGAVDFTRTSRSEAGGAFGGLNFNPIFMIGYKQLLLFEAEVEVEGVSNGGADFVLEFAQLDLFATDWLTFTAGKFLSPLGDFQQHLHPAWINKLPFRPAGFEGGGTEHRSEVGAMVRGAFPVGGATADYALFVGNGPRLSTNPAKGILLKGFTDDDNSNKAVGGRIGLRPLPFFAVGFSGMVSKIKGNAGTGGWVNQSTYSMIVLDAAYTKGNWDIRGEYIRAHLNSLTTALSTTVGPMKIPGTTWHAWYVQGAYRLAGITSNPVFSKFEPVFRYSEYRISGLPQFQALEEKRVTVGLNYWFAPSIVAKAAFEYRNFQHKLNDKVFKLKIAFGF